MFTGLLHIWLVVLIWVVLKSLVTVRSKIARQDTEAGGRLEGKRSEGDRKRGIRIGERGKYLPLWTACY